MSEHETIDVVAYCRVSSDEQREKESIKTQVDAIEAYLRANPHLHLLQWYLDDGVTGTKPMADRPHGGELWRDAGGRRFAKILVTRPNRVARRAVLTLNAVEYFDSCGVEVVGVVDAMDDRFMLGIKAVVAEEERRTLLENTAMGTARAAREGRYCGGISSIGYKVEGKKQTARLVVSDDLMWRTWPESDVVRQIFGWSALDGWSCRRIAEHLNSLGVPTAYQLAGRSVRKKRTRGEWTPGRIRQILTSTVYKGVYQYGKRGKGAVIEAAVPSIVTNEIWNAAQETLARHNRRPKHAKNIFLCRSIIVCSVCGLHFSGTMGRGVVWYRCNGQIAWRGKLKGKCHAKGIDGRALDPIVWDDVLLWLSSPGDVLDELAMEQNANGASVVAEAERVLVESALADLVDGRNRIIDLYRRKMIELPEYETQMDEIIAEREKLEARRRELEPKVALEDDVITSETLLAAIRERVARGLTDAERQEIVQLLVRRIVVNTEIVDGKKRATVSIEYRFPAVTPTVTGTRVGQNYSNPTRVVRL